MVQELRLNNNKKSVYTGKLSKKNGKQIPWQPDDRISFNVARNDVDCAPRTFFEAGAEIFTEDVECYPKLRPSSENNGIHASVLTIFLVSFSLFSRGAISKNCPNTRTLTLLNNLL